MSVAPCRHAVVPVTPRLGGPPRRRGSWPEVRTFPPLHHRLGDQEVSPYTGVQPPAAAAARGTVLSGFAGQQLRWSAAELSPGAVEKSRVSLAPGHGSLA